MKAMILIATYGRPSSHDLQKTHHWWKIVLGLLILSRVVRKAYKWPSLGNMNRLEGPMILS